MFTMKKTGNLLQKLDTIDVVVDGPFIEELKDTKLKFRGSINQNVNIKGVDF